MNVAILSGCDIEWQPYSEPSSSAPTTLEAVLGSANSGVDKSSSGSEPLVTKAATPVFGLKSAEPAAAPPAASGAVDPPPASQEHFLILRANTAANGD